MDFSLLLWQFSKLIYIWVSFVQCYICYISSTLFMYVLASYSYFVYFLLLFINIWFNSRERMGRLDATTLYTQQNKQRLYYKTHDFSSHLIASLYHAHIRQCNSGVRDSGEHWLACVWTNAYRAFVGPLIHTISPFPAHTTCNLNIDPNNPSGVPLETGIHTCAKTLCI